MEIIFNLQDAGWADGSVIIEGKEIFNYDVSYLQDVLGSLASSAVNIINGSKFERFFWWSEPGEYLWVIQEENNKLRIKIDVYDDWGSELENGEYQNNSKLFESFEAVLDKNEFISAVYQCLKSVYEEYGEKGYKDKWIEHDFPMKDFKEIGVYLKV
jgi:hypothetical protein